MATESVKLMVGQAFPDAPLGVLGSFIETKLREYVEPDRAGTPKGQPIGFSRKKYHAALLAMTNIDLRKQAKHIKVSYGLLRKWRTERAFDEKVRKLVQEFMEQRYVPAYELSLDMLLAQNPKMRDLIVGAESDLGYSNGLRGFEDISLYGNILIIELEHLFNMAVGEINKSGGSPDKALNLLRPLIRLYRGMPQSETPHKWWRRLALGLFELQRWVAMNCQDTKDLDRLRTIATLIKEALRL